MAAQHIPDEGPVSEQAGHELHAVKMLDGALLLRSREIHGYRHILAAMSCSSLPTASA